MIKQILRNDQTVQTDLVVEVDGIRVKYWRCDGFWFEFLVFADVPQDKADAAVNEVISAMIWQSEDHGARWDMIELEHHLPEPRQPMYMYRAHFRIRDAG